MRTRTELEPEQHVAETGVVSDEARWAKPQCQGPVALTAPNSQKIGQKADGYPSRGAQKARHPHPRWPHAPVAAMAAQPATALRMQWAAAAQVGRRNISPPPRALRLPRLGLRVPAIGSLRSTFRPLLAEFWIFPPVRDCVE